MKILIPDSLVRSALAATRSLGRKGYHITAAIPNKGFKVSPFFKFGLSKYCKKCYRITSPFEDISQYQNDILEIVTRNHFDVILPFNNISAIAIAQIKGKLPAHVMAPVPDFEIIQKVHDKAKTFTLAKEKNIPTPQTRTPQTEEELQAAIDEMPYPLVIKARKNSGPRGIRFAKTKQEAQDFFAEIHKLRPPSLFDDYRFPILQEFIPGEIYDVFLIYDNGTLLTSLAQQRVRTYPIYGGVTAAAKVIKNQKLEELAKRLMEGEGWHGCCDLEFKFDWRDQQFKLLEINPRFPGALDVAIQAGVDFAEIAAWLGDTRELGQHYDVREDLLYRFIASHEIYNLCQGLTIKRILEFFNIFKRNAAYDFCLHDMGPNIYGLVSILKKLIFNRREVLGNKGEDFNRLFQKNKK